MKRLRLPKPAQPTLREAAEKWIRENPRAMRLFRGYANQAAEAGVQFGIGALAERVRWHVRVHTTGMDDCKINNSYRAYIARALLESDPNLANWMTMRATPSADRPKRIPHRPIARVGVV